MSAASHDGPSRTVHSGRRLAAVVRRADVQARRYPQAPLQPIVGVADGDGRHGPFPPSVHVAQHQATAASDLNRDVLPAE